MKHSGHYRVRLKSLIGSLTFTFALLACAQTPQSLSSPAIWLEPQGESVTLLLADGNVFRSTGETLTKLDSGFQGDSLTACNGNFLGINADGQLAYVGQTSSSLKVALHHRPLCLADGRVAALSEKADALVLLSLELQELARVPVNALSDAEIISADLTGDGQEEIVLLTEPSTRYQHGVIGDDLEGISLAVFTNTLEPLASFTLPEPFVFEQRRVLPFNMGAKDGILATRSSSRSGAGVVLLSLEEGNLTISAEAPPIGSGFRWLNLFASQDGFAYAVRTPHIGGAFQRYQLDNDKLTIEPFQLGVTNHVIGSRNLDLGVLLPSSSSSPTFALPNQALNQIKLISCNADACAVLNSFDLEARLSSNLSYSTKEGQLFIAATDTAGNFYSFAFTP